MNPVDVDMAKSIGNTVKRNTRNVKKTEIVLCPPFVYLSSLGNVPTNNISLGAQDAFYEPMGHYTGEVSSSQLYQFKVRYVIVGHSERRAEGETDEIINKKTRAVVGDGMTVILCVGEKTRDPHGDYLTTVRQQIVEGLKDISKKSVDSLVIAYEPIWAVGAKSAMNPIEIHEMSIFIKKVLRDIYGILGDGIRILYGGDVTSANADHIVRDGNVSGVLIGRESLNARDFVDIIKLIDSI